MRLTIIQNMLKDHEKRIKELEEKKQNAPQDKKEKSLSVGESLGTQSTAGEDKNTEECLSSVDNHPSENTLKTPEKVESKTNDSNEKVKGKREVKND